jgi:hypothetical protein
VKHHVPCELPVVYFQFEADQAVGSFTVQVSSRYERRRAASAAGTFVSWLSKP